ncbi:Pleiotropic drug resistance protein 2 [Camellia lanceoleosa]|uniref:Pleiotropic drug resistance protein 2 n=1 Tax=Camellia lanceoleosa TaxID=1840588 RepID=A0ACC0GQI4_9ERIC|nr:Pleiotropic drug resistance protein 2 [Camellia lanceoleosa]
MLLRMTLLFGPPGSGKTTLLKALAGKSDDNLKISGKVTYCGREFKEFVPQRTSAYISYGLCIYFTVLLSFAFPTLWGKPIRVNKVSQDKKSLDVGANLFVGNLDPIRNLMHSNDVDEKLLYDTFSAFGVIVTNPKNAGCF